MSPTDIIICHLLKKHGELTQEQIEVLSGLHQSTISRAKKRLVNDSVITQRRDWPHTYLNLRQQFYNKIKIL